jgi:mono/diheme cytochrome c family protein
MLVDMYRLILALAAGAAMAAEHPVVALLRSKCAACHGPQLQQGKLDVTRRDALMRGGDRGASIVPGKSRDSILYQMVAHQMEPAMPFKSAKLAQSEIDAVAKWIDSGAPWEAELVFVSTIKPLFESQCVTCHAGAARKSGLDLTARAKLLEGGDHGPGIDLAAPESSALVKRLRHQTAPGMPFNGPKVSDSTVAAVVEWIRAGAPYDAEIAAPKQTTAAPVDRSHWAFQKPRRSPPPAARPAGFTPRNPIDQFLAAGWSRLNLVPAPPADRRTLIRRVHIDLTGLPPTLAETRAFVADNSPGAYERAVDRLLESPRHGERWGRHWMDVWRYSDWYGRRDLDDHRNSFRHIWRWRDWIIESMNQDKGYDRMILEMLAGDEIAPADPDTLRATGYLARNFHRFNRNVWMQDVVEHVSAGMLGVTMKCARCHDHKYDPIAQEEYYKFRSFFEPYDVRLDRVPGQADTRDDGLARAFDSVPRKGTIEPYISPIYEKTFRFVRGDETNPDTSREMLPGVPAALGEWDARYEPIRLPAVAHSPDTRDFVQRDLVAAAERDLARHEQAIVNARAWIGRIRAGHVPARADGLDKVQSVLKRRCAGCHAAPVKSEFSIANGAAAVRGGLVHGAAVVAGDAAASALVRYARGEGAHTPMPEREMEPVLRWIEQAKPQESARAVEEAELRLGRLERIVEAKRLAVPALRARIAADVAPDDKELAKKAREAERRMHVAQAQADVWEATQELAKGADPDKQAAGAKRKLEAAAAVLGKAADNHTPALEKFREDSTGRRFALARWIAAKENPLTARVAVNHMWLRHFGKALVPTVTNFGRNGAKPLDQALLDWLAVEFMESGWSMKHMHRLMVTSAAYRLASDAPPQKADPDNNHFWRMNPRRMEGEVVRDSALALAGALDPTMGGPEIDERDGMISRRRSVYLRHTPDSQVEFLRLFDQPSPAECYFRTESVVPQQALAVANGLLTQDAARLLARSLDTHRDPDGFVRAAFETVVGQPPTADEIKASREFLSQQASILADPARLTKTDAPSESTVAPATDPADRARENLVHALLNHNEFVTVR